MRTNLKINLRDKWGQIFIFTMILLPSCIPLAGADPTSMAKTSQITPTYHQETPTITITPTSPITKTSLITPTLATAIPVTREVFQYAPTIVQLTGVIREQIAPGPPYWEEGRIETGAEPVTYWVLYLSRQIDVGDGSAPDPQTKVSFIEVVLYEGNYENYIEKPVQVTGTLVYNDWGHHITTISIIAEKIVVLP